MPGKPVRSTRLTRKQELIQALAEFLGGTNQARMSIYLSMNRGELYEVAKHWARMRSAVPGLHGYPSVEETVAVLEEFLG